MQEVFIQGKAYTFVKNFKDVDKLRESFNELAEKTFGFNFEEWYRCGYWGDSYIPYSLLDGEKIVANVSVSIMDFVQIAESKKYVQIGTVMTDEEYRSRGLAKYLMGRVIEEYKDKCDNIYLFANDSVLEFYPKFGFVSAEEYQYSISFVSNNKASKLEKLDMSLLENRELLVKKASNSFVSSKLGMINNTGLIMFYCTSFLMDNVYYLEDQDVIIIAEYEGETLILIDIFSESEFKLESVIHSLCNENIKRVVLGFTPESTDGYDITKMNNESTTLFFLKINEQFTKNKLMFPILSHT